MRRCLRDSVIEGVQHANRTSAEVLGLGLLNSWSYDIPNIVDPAAVHEQINVAKAQLDSVRRNSKVRWASVETELEFSEWLVQHGHADLVNG